MRSKKIRRVVLDALKAFYRQLCNISAWNLIVHAVISVLIVGSLVSIGHLTEMLVRAVV